MRTGLVVACLAVVAATGFSILRGADAPGQEATDLGFPPIVVQTEPQNRARTVDFALQEIKVTFDRPMQTEKAYSWIIHTNLGVYPGYQGAPEPRWEDDGRTCVLPVKLSPDTLYAVGVNSFRHGGFRTVDGQVAVPHVWVFRTKGAVADPGR